MSRRHSKFSASGAERWMNCPGSVELSEGIPEVSSIYAMEGTKAHGVLERVLADYVKSGITPQPDLKAYLSPALEMARHAKNAANFISKLQREYKGDLLVETRVALPFIHPDMFGTFDSAVVDHFGTLHVIDYKYGSGHAVSPTKNLQMTFYSIGLAAKYDWNFKRVKMWIIQPRIKNYKGPKFWELNILELKKYVELFKAGVKQVEAKPNKFVAGSWCYFCRASVKCPLKIQGRNEKARNVFLNK